MKSKAPSSILVSAFLVLSFVTGPVAQAGLRDIIGQVAGGVIGGALCNELGLGRGNGRTAMVAICAVGGAMIGGEIAKDMDEADARAFEEEQRRSFEGDLNRDYEWNGRSYGSHTGINGRLRPVRHGYHSRTREVCREYQSTTYRGNRAVENKSIVCRKSDGSFYSLEEKTLFVNGRVVERETNERSGGGNQPPYITPDRRPAPPRPVPMPDDNYRRGDDRRGDGRYDDNNGRGDRRGGRGNDRRDGRGDDRRDRCSAWNVGSLQYGDQVVTRYGQVGSFQGVNRSGREASVRVGSFLQTVVVNDLGLSGCHLGLSTGQLVTTRYGQQGSLIAIFSNGDLAIQIGQFIQITKRDDVFFR